MPNCITRCFGKVKAHQDDEEMYCPKDAATSTTAAKGDMDAVVESQLSSKPDVRPKVSAWMTLKLFWRRQFSSKRIVKFSWRRPFRRGRSGIPDVQSVQSSCNSNVSTTQTDLDRWNEDEDIVFMDERMTEEVNEAIGDVCSQFVSAMWEPQSSGVTMSPTNACTIEDNTVTYTPVTPFSLDSDDDVQSDVTSIWDSDNVSHVTSIWASDDESEATSVWDSDSDVVSEPDIANMSDFL